MCRQGQEEGLYYMGWNGFGMKLGTESSMIRKLGRLNDKGNTFITPDCATADVFRSFRAALISYVLSYEGQNSKEIKHPLWHSDRQSGHK